MPMWNSRRGSEKGMEFRTRFGDLNSFVLDSLRGLDETIQYGCGEKREEQMERKSVELDAKQKEMKKLEGTQRGGTNVLILIFSFGMLFLTTWLHQQGEIGFDAEHFSTYLVKASNSAYKIIKWYVNGEVSQKNIYKSRECAKLQWHSV